MALATAADVKAWVAGGGTVPTGVDDTVLGVCITAATEAIIDDTGRIWEKTAIAETLDGDRAVGVSKEILLLRRFPVFPPPGDAVTITENGVALSVAIGYSTTADVILRNPGLERQAHLIRRTCSWASGVANISVAYQAGFATNAPERIRYVAKELAWLLYTEGRKSGMETVSQGGGAAGLVHKLSDLSRSILAQARRW